MSEMLIKKYGRVALIRFNRPNSLNILSLDFFEQLNKALDTVEADSSVAVIVLMGSEKIFSAGADITEFQSLSTSQQACEKDWITKFWEKIPCCQKPTIAAVKGLALGGGFELALMCDMIVATQNARFAQPEIKIGTIPGAGGTQRLTRAIGKARAMELCLTGRMISAEEAMQLGLLTKVVADDDLESSALSLATSIAAYSLPIIKQIKQAIVAAHETHLQQGIALERQLFYSTFDLEDRDEGMQAFIDKRLPQFRDR